MAHFALTIDENPAHQEHFASRAAAALASLSGLEIGHVTRGRLALVWARNPASPWSHHTSSAGTALLLGYAVDNGGTWIDSHQLWNEWRNPVSPFAFGGYFAGVAWSSEHGLIVGGDLLGLFPIYYAQLGSSLVVGSSLELFRAHPAFEFRLDAEGLAGVLLTNGLVDNRTLCANVRRLGQGHLLHWSQQSQPREIEIFRVRNTDRPNVVTADDARVLADAELRRVIRAHRPSSQRSVVMLSGGLDSRVIAGYVRAEGIVDTAVCLGRSFDLEVRVGSRVARTLGMRVHREAGELQPAAFATAAARVARWERLASGFSHLEAEASGETLAEVAPMFWSGFALEDVLAAAVRTMALDEKKGVWSYRRFLDHLNTWGIPADLLRQLVSGADASAVVEAPLDRLRAAYHRESESEAQRALRAKFATRVRFHVGGVLHRMSFRCWPLLPILDARFLQLQFNVPAELMIQRRLQKDLLNHFHPDLAAIPREHNTFRLEPLKPVLFGQFRCVLGGKFRRWYWRHWRNDDPRRYVRYYDLNGPLWRAVRETAEPRRTQLNGEIDRATFDRILPHPTSQLHFRDPFAQSTPARLLLGYLLAG